MEALKICDTTKINDYKEVDNLELSTITKNNSDKERLSGLILYGYEMKFGDKNENQEKYTPDSITKYIQKYFVENKLNIPVTILHRDDIQHLAGRVLVVETNGVGFYLVAYVPKSYVNYSILVNLIKDGILQGFSKEGWATDYEYHYKENRDLDFVLIKELMFNKLSIVDTPANGLNFERIATTVENSTKFVNNVPKKDRTLEQELGL